jgi:hypothetical protein
MIRKMKKRKKHKQIVKTILNHMHIQKLRYKLTIQIHILTNKQQVSDKTITNAMDCLKILINLHLSMWYKNKKNKESNYQKHIMMQ